MIRLWMVFSLIEIKRNLSLCDLTFKHLSEVSHLSFTEKKNSLNNCTYGTNSQIQIDTLRE